MPRWGRQNALYDGKRWLSALCPVTNFKKIFVGVWPFVDPVHDGE